MIKKIIDFLTHNPITFTLLNLLTYCFYALVIGISLIPSIIIVLYSYNSFILPLGGATTQAVLNIFIFAFCLGLAFFTYLLTGLLVTGTVQRLLVIGFKEGKYSIDSLLFSRWLIYSGIHVIVVHSILPFIAGSPFMLMYYRLIGCKIGKNVFINTPGLHDCYLLEIGDNVVIGGSANISCHIFEGNHLTLGKIKIGDNTLVGTEAYIMPGVTIEGNSNIGMFAYLRKNKIIPKGSMIMALPGLPAKQIAKIEKESHSKEI